jgi:hypothetical protein
MDKPQIIAAWLPFGQNPFAKLAMRIAVLAVFGAALWIDTARAIDPPNACDGSPAPNCQQVVARGTLGRLGTTGWALYCPREAPYWWNNSKHAATRTTSFTENPFEESNNKADFTITNWSSLGSSDWAISIDCSPIDPNGGGCTGQSRMVSDPGCPESNRRTTCHGADNCWLEWDERCVDGDKVTNYFCSGVAFAIYCWTCQ